MKFSIDLNDGGLRAFNAMTNFVRGLMLSSIIQCDKDLILKLVFQAESQICNPHPGGLALDRIMFSIENPKAGVTLYVTNNFPVNGSTPFFTLGDETGAISMSEITGALLG